MSDIAALGFVASEMSPVYPQEPRALVTALASHGLTLSAAFSWVTLAHEELLAEEVERARRHVEFCRAAGARHVIVAEASNSVWDARGPQPTVAPLSDKQWRRLSAAFDELGAYANGLGLTLSVHPHGGTAIETPDEVERLLASTDPQLVGYCLDSGHVAYGGGDALQVAERFAGRVRYVHLKDVRVPALRRAQAEGATFRQAVERHVFAAPGAGDLDFEGVVAVLRRAGYRGWYVVEAEQDPTVHDPALVTGAARRYLQERFGL